MNQKEQIRKELNEYLDKYIPRTEIDIYKYVVDFIEKDRKKQLTLTDVSQQRELLSEFEELNILIQDIYEFMDRQKLDSALAKLEKIKVDVVGK